MQSTTYKCDQCSKVIGTKHHISLSFGQYSGIAVPPTPTTDILVEALGYQAHWRVKGSLNGQFVHFCNPVCLQGYFVKLMYKVMNEDKPEKISVKRKVTRKKK